MTNVSLKLTMLHFSGHAACLGVGNRRRGLHCRDGEFSTRAPAHRATGDTVIQRESVLYWQPTGPSPPCHLCSRPSLSHGSLNYLFHEALYIPAYGHPHTALSSNFCARIKKACHKRDRRIPSVSLRYCLACGPWILRFRVIEETSIQTSVMICLYICCMHTSIHRRVIVEAGSTPPAAHP
jgi:hypothetical protein